MLVRLAVVDMPVSDLILDSENPRTHSRRQLRQIMRSIRRFGFVVPILIRYNKVIAGHGRLEAAKLLGMAFVPTINLDHLTEAEAKALAIADNRLAENSVWDERLLGEQMKLINKLDLDLDLTITGFEAPEIDTLIIGTEETPSESGPEDVPLPAGPPVSEANSLWICEGHRVLCGDATNTEAFSMLMDGATAAMIFTDPPYNVKVSNISGLGVVQHREFAMAAGEMSSEQFTTFLTMVMQLLAAHSRDGSAHYLCMDWRHCAELLEASRTVYDEHLNTCVWDKGRAGMGSFYRSEHEEIFVFCKGKEGHINNIQLGKFGRNRSNIWRYAGPRSHGEGKEGVLLALHPTIKPTAMIADAIKDVSHRNDVVLDCFLGSGSTLIAAERTGRRCYGLELDPLYVDTAIRRWQAYTGRDAICATTGKTFDECEAEAQENRDAAE